MQIFKVSIQVKPKQDLDQIFHVTLDWLASGEALAIYNLIIDQRSHQPTLNGAIWLQEANIKAEEIYMFNK